VLTKWFASGGKRGPQGLSALRTARFGNDAEETAFSRYLDDLSAAAASSVAPIATPAICDSAVAAGTAIAPVAPSAAAKVPSVAAEAKPNETLPHALAVPAIPAFIAAPLPPGSNNQALRGKIAELHRLADSTAEWIGPTLNSGIKCYSAADGTPSCRGDGFVPFPRKAMLELLLAIDGEIIV